MDEEFFEQGPKQYDRQIGDHRMAANVSDIVKRLRDRKGFWLNGHSWVMATTQDADCAEAADEIERLQIDAERYRWLRVHSTGPVEPWSTHSAPESLDRAVDEAMAKASSR